MRSSLCVSTPNTVCNLRTLLLTYFLTPISYLATTFRHSAQLQCLHFPPAAASQCNGCKDYRTEASQDWSVGTRVKLSLHGLMCQLRGHETHCPPFGRSDSASHCAAHWHKV